MPNKNLWQAAGDGTAVPAGVIGEIVSAGTITSTSVSTTTIDVASSAGGAFRVSLKKGVWLLNYSLSVSYTTGTVANNNGFITTFITDNNNVAIPNTQRALNAYTPTAVAVSGFGCVACSTVVTVTTDDTVYKIRAIIANNAGTGSGTVDRSAGGALYDSSFFAIRIA